MRGPYFEYIKMHKSPSLFRIVSQFYFLNKFIIIFDYLGTSFILNITSAIPKLLENLKFLTEYHYRGKGPRSHNGPWAPYEKIDHVRGEDVGAKRAPGPALVGLKMFRRRFEEKCLLGRNKYVSNMHSTCQKDPPQRALVTRMSPTGPQEGRKRRVSKERLQLPH